MSAPIKKLLYREWITVSIVLGLMGSVTLFSWGAPHHHKASQQLKRAAILPAKISLTVEGAVKNPGTYFFTPGITLKEVVREVGLTKNADRKNIEFKKVFYESQEVAIPQKGSF